MTGQTYLSNLALTLGATEPALRLLLSILIGYPLALIHRYGLFNKNPNLQHIFFIVSGLSIGYFNYGNEVIHSMVSVLGVYLILFVFGGTALSVILVFTFAMGYLLNGYYMTGTETYDIKWSMPQCVLTLRLIGLAFDVFDGTKPPGELSEEQKKTTLKSVPTFLEVAAHTYFPASFLVGPQFPMTRYRSFVLNTFKSTKSKSQELPQCLLAGVKRGGLGFLYLGIFQVGTSWIPDSYLLSPEYDMKPLWQRCLLMGIWGKITLYKYISCWLISEGVCIATGLTYNGKTADGKDRWDGCANVKLTVFEGATKFGHFITSFNTNTNHWVAQYVYKRLKFLGNRYLSQALALLFLAVWHGLHSGYYMCFFLEFVVVKLEKDVETILAKNKEVTAFLQRPVVKSVLWVLLKLYTLVFMGYCLVPFALLSFSKWWHVFKSVYFMGHVIFAMWPLYAPLVKYLLTPKAPKNM